MRHICRRTVQDASQPPPPFLVLLRSSCPAAAAQLSGDKQGLFSLTAIRCNADGSQGYARVAVLIDWYRQSERQRLSFENLVVL